MFERLEDRRLLCFPVSGSPFQNPVNPCDVNDNGEVSGLDGILILNFISTNGSGPPPVGFQPPPFLDVDGDGLVNQEDVDVVAEVVAGGGAARPVVLSTTIGSNSQNVIIQFSDDDLNQSTAESSNNYLLTAANGDANSNGNFFDDGNESSVQIAGVVYSAATDQVTLTFASVLADDVFRLELDGTAIQDLDGNGLLGGNFLRDLDLRVTPIGPEIDVSGLGNSIADGDTTPSATDDTDFGSVALVGATSANTFTITNSGSETLNLSGNPRVTISGANAADFTLATDAAATVASGGGTTTFVITFDPSATGLRMATVSIASDDADENPYDFAIQGTGMEVATNAGVLDVTGDGDFQSIPRRDSDRSLHARPTRCQLGGSGSDSSRVNANHGRGNSRFLGSRRQCPRCQWRWDDQSVPRRHLDRPFSAGAARCELGGSCPDPRWIDANHGGGDSRLPRNAAATSIGRRVRAAGIRRG